MKLQTPPVTELAGSHFFHTNNERAETSSEAAPLLPALCRSLSRTWASPAQVVKHHDVGIHIVQIVGVGRVLLRSPLLGLWAFSGEHVSTMLGLIIHAVEASDLLGRVTKKWHLKAPRPHHSQGSVAHPAPLHLATAQL